MAHDLLGLTCKLSQLLRARFVVGWIIPAIITAACSACTDVDIYSRPAVDGTATNLARAMPYDRGKHYLAAGHLGLAATAFRTALSQGTATAEILNALAVTYDRLGRFDLAQRYYARALELDPESVQSLNNLGYSALLQGNHALAAKFLIKARTIDAANTVVQANLALLREKIVSANGAADSLGSDRNSGGRKVARQEIPPLKTTWIERTAVKIQTLVTEPDPSVVAATSLAGVEPELGAATVIRIAGFEPFHFTRRTRFPRITQPIEGVFVLNSGTRTVVAMPSPKPNATEQRQLLRASLQMNAQAGIVRQGHDASSEGKGSSPKPNLSAALIEVSNGAGRRLMARRIQSYLESKSVKVERRTNDVSFDNAHTIVFYRPEFGAEAKAIAELLPVSAEVRKSEEGWSSVRVLIGKDLLDFDETLMAKSEYEI